jgi:integrase/recombinase XerD
MTPVESTPVIPHPCVLPTGQLPEYPRQEPVTQRNSLDRPPSLLSRKSLDRAVQHIEAAQLLGSEHLIGYLHDLYRRNCKSGTIRYAAVAICSFLRLLGELSIVRLKDIRRTHIGAFIEHEQDRGLKVNSVRQRLQNVYAFVRYLDREDQVAPELLLRKIHLKLPQRLPRAIAPEDVVKLLSVIGQVRDRAIVLLLLRTGMRIGEVLNLLVSDVDLIGRMVKIYEGEKNCVGRVVYLSEDARKALSDWIRERQPHQPRLFYSRCRSSLSYNAVRMRFRKHLQQAGIGDKGYTLHCLRHTCATELLNAGMRIECLQQLLGHSKLEVTRVYARLTDKTREDEYFKAMAIIEAGRM